MRRPARLEVTLQGSGPAQFTWTHNFLALAGQGLETENRSHGKNEAAAGRLDAATEVV